VNRTKRARRSIREVAEGRKPIRVFIDTTFIENPDVYACREVGQVNYWADGTCTEDDLLTPAKKDALLGTLENVKNFYEQLLAVTPCETPFPLASYDDEPVSREMSDGQTDMHFTIYLRSFGQGSSVLASAGPRSLSGTDLRPIQGLVNVGVAMIPGRAQSYDKRGDRAFFEVLVHELMHAFAISSGLFRYWRNSARDDVYKEEDFSYSHVVSAYPGKTFTFIRTPKIHELIARRWGSEYFFDDPNCPAGVEIEDGGGQGTLGSHWEMRTHLTEVMVGMTIGNQQISELSLAALEDSGWYGVNYSLAEPVMWGDYRSIVGAKLEDFKAFGYGPPVTSFPKHYLLSPQAVSQGRMCTFDHQGLAYIRAYTRDCGNWRGGECAYPEFYDPRNDGLYASMLPDYALIALGQFGSWCKDGIDAPFAPSSGGAHGPALMCAMTSDTTAACFNMSCPSDTQLLIHVRNEARDCNETGTKVSFPGYYGNIICPDPAIVCGVLRYPVNVEGNDNKLSTGAIIAIVVVVIGCVCTRRVKDVELLP
jgi:hypothetical protein